MDNFMTAVEGSLKSGLHGGAPTFLIIIGIFIAIAVIIAIVKVFSIFKQKDSTSKSKDTPKSKNPVSYGQWSILSITLLLNLVIFIVCGWAIGSIMLLPIATAFSVSISNTHVSGTIRWVLFTTILGSLSFVLFGVYLMFASAVPALPQINATKDFITSIFSLATAIGVFFVIVQNHSFAQKRQEAQLKQTHDLATERQIAE